MAKLIKLSDHKAYRISIIQMGRNVKGEERKPKMLSIRQMYKTKKDPDTWKPGYGGITIPLGNFGKRIIRAIIAVFKDPEPKIEIIEIKEREAKPKRKNNKRSK